MEYQCQTSYVNPDLSCAELLSTGADDCAECFKHLLFMKLFPYSATFMQLMTEHSCPRKTKNLGNESSCCIIELTWADLFPLCILNLYMYIYFLYTLSTQWFLNVQGLKDQGRLLKTSLNSWFIDACVSHSLTEGFFSSFKNNYNRLDITVSITFNFVS